MSFTDAFDPRFGLSFYEVHYWPHINRVLVIHKPSYDSAPIVTDIVITHKVDESVVYVLATALADAGVPSGGIVRHHIDGSMWREVNPGTVVPA